MGEREEAKEEKKIINTKNKASFQPRDLLGKQAGQPTRKTRKARIYQS